SLTAGWTAATDDTAPSAAIVYQVCWSTSATACASAFTAMATTAAGATSFAATGLSPATAYHFVARAKDPAGNVDANTVVKTGTTAPDTTPPVGGVASSLSRTGCGTATV